METPYRLAGGRIVEVETGAETAEQLAVFERKERSERRKARRRKDVSIEVLYEETGWELTDITVNIEADYIAKEERESLAAAVSGLSEKHRRLVRLKFYEQKTDAEIASLLGISRPAVTQQLGTIKTVLKKLLEKF